MSAPPDSSASPNQSFRMSGQNHQEQHTEQHSNVRHIPIFVEGRDEPVINKSVDHGTHYGESKPAYQPPPQPQPHIDREQYFADDGPTGFHHPPNFSRAFSTPFNKGFRQGPQPFVQQKVYPQAAYTRGASPYRSQSPKSHAYPEEPYVKVPVHHEQHAAKTETPSRTMPQQRQAPPQQHQPPHPQQQKQPPPPQQQRQQTPPQQAPSREQTPPLPKQPTPNDPITLILSIQTDVLNLMTEVENFKGFKNDKQYLFLDEMLTRNLIKLDNIETEGKENIRLARKEAIKCIQKCIAVLEAKAEKNSAASKSQADVELNENTEEQTAEPAAENGEVEEQGQNEPQVQVPADQHANVAPQEMKTESQQVQQPDEAKIEEKKPEAAQAPQPETRPEEKTQEPSTENKEQKDEIETPKTKVVKKRNNSEDNKKDVTNDSCKQDKEDSNKGQKQVDEKSDKVEVMQVDGDKTEQGMEVDGAASQ